MFTRNNPDYVKALERAKELLSKMTLEEKVIQLTQYVGHDHSYNPEQKDKTGANNAGRCGSLLAACGVESVNSLQKIALEYTPHNIPIITGCDVIHGYWTTYPIPLGMSCTFEPDLVRKCYGATGKEAKSDGVHWVYAPMVDVVRDSRWGRVAESFGEDTFLASKMSEAAVKGFQNDGGVMACMKHFVAYGACEGGRDYNGCDMSDQTLFNTYIPPFQAGVDAGVGTFMNAFNDINGVPCAGNKRVMTDILRGKMGFDGFVVSDYDAVIELINHGYAENEKDAALKGFDAGIDVLMLGNLYNNHLPELVGEGKISMEQIDYSVLRILTAKYLIGVMDEPFVDDKTPQPFMTDESLALAREVAKKSLVLLENDGTLPLTREAYKGKKIGLTGPIATEVDNLLGCWASCKQPERTLTLKAAFEEAYPESEVITETGISFLDEDTSVEKALEKMADCDVIVAAMAERYWDTGEATSKVSLELAADQRDYIEKLSALGKPVVLLISAGRPLLLGEIKDKVNALLYIWAPGSEGAHAVCDVVTGDYSPCAKTTMSFPYASGQMPLYYNHRSTGRPAFDKMKFECKYIDCPIGALYPFGYGLSYSEFEYTDAVISKNVFTADETIGLCFNVTNKGKYIADEVVQIYTRDLFGSITRPVKELKAFEKITLAPDETKNVKIALPVSELAFWNAEMNYVVEPGKFKLWIAHHSDDNAIEFDFEVPE